MYYNYQKIIKDLYAMMRMPENREYGHTIQLMLDETVYHYLEANNVPFERQEEFLAVMFCDCPQVVTDYKNKKFTLS